MLVCEAADELLAARGAASLSAVGLDLALLPRVERIVRVAAFAHDLGKCSAHFQAMVRRTRDERQLVRHEAASLWLCWPGQPLAGWLRAAVADSDDDLRVAVVAAAGHHRKFWSRAVEHDGAGTSVDLLTDHDDFADLLAAGARRLGISPPPDVPRQCLEVGRRKSLPRCFEDWQEEWRDLERREPVHGTLARLAKVLVLGADLAGSILPKESLKPAWIRGELDRRATAEELAGIATARLGGHAPRAFQEQVAASAAPVTFVRAGCGSGKTVAAYLWAARHAGRQLWVTYPTTGTTTEGFRDYVAEDPELFARLEHGRRSVDLEVFGFRADDDEARQRARLDALESWGSKVVVATVDTVLGLMQHQRKGMYGWPGLAHASVVFDEIHAFDDALFGALLRFLEALPGVPVLLMTASLPAARLESLRALVARVHGAPLAEIAGPADLEQLPRYLRSHDDPHAAARACLERGGKVLWVSNTVDRCLAVAEAFEGRQPRVYHSRFRYVDRVDRHAEVIRAFAAPGPVLATTTQVAEMSLDLSADLLVTELAPISALIQRLGRLNRRATPARPGAPCPFVVIDVERATPYQERELDVARRWLAALGDGPLSQADLVAAWERCAESEPPAARQVANWVDGGFETEPRELRKSTPGITVLLERDAAEVRRTPSRAVALALPMSAPSRVRWKEWPQAGYLPIAPDSAVTYDPQRGGRWK